LAPLVVDELLAAHADQQLEQLPRVVQVVLPQGGAHEETAEDRLADVHGIEEAAQARVDEADADGPADGRLVQPDPFPARPLAPGPDPGDEGTNPLALRTVRPGPLPETRARGPSLWRRRPAVGKWVGAEGHPESSRPGGEKKQLNPFAFSLHMARPTV